MNVEFSLFDWPKKLNQQRLKLLRDTFWWQTLTCKTICDENGKFFVIGNNDCTEGLNNSFNKFLGRRRYS